MSTKSSYTHNPESPKPNHKPVDHATWTTAMPFLNPAFEMQKIQSPNRSSQLDRHFYQERSADDSQSSLSLLKILLGLRTWVSLFYSH
jgi:hypothetical protein